MVVNQMHIRFFDHAKIEKEKDKSKLIVTKFFNNMKMVAKYARTHKKF